LSIYGGVGRYPQFKKHSLRVLFKTVYGAGKLDFPLFGDQATEQFDTFILRSNFNDGWTWGGTQSQFIRDQFADRTLLAMMSTAAYQRVQGNFPDGTDDPATESLLDVNNYVDYTLVNFFVCNADWPGHNWYVGRPRGTASTGFKFFPWDTEMAVGLAWIRSPAGDVTGVGAADSNDPAEPYYWLQMNADFQMLFADHAHTALFNGGALTTASAVARYQALADEVGAAVSAESARWGDVVTGAPYKPTDWQNERDWLLNTYLPQRNGSLIQQLRNRGLYPTTEAPTFFVNGVYQHGGTPGLPNVPIDKSAPLAPANLTGHVTVNPDKITLSWTATAAPLVNGNSYSLTTRALAGAVLRQDGIHGSLLQAYLDLTWTWESERVNPKQNSSDGEAASQALFDQVFADQNRQLVGGRVRLPPPPSPSPATPRVRWPPCGETGLPWRRLGRGTGARRCPSSR